MEDSSETSSRELPADGHGANERFFERTVAAARRRPRLSAEGRASAAQCASLHRPGADPRRVAVPPAGRESVTLPRTRRRGTTVLRTVQVTTVRE